MRGGVPEFGVGDLADRIGEVVYISEGYKGLTGDEHLHELFGYWESFLEAFLVEKLEDHGQGQRLELPEVDLAVDFLGEAVQPHQLAGQDQQLQVEETGAGVISLG